MGLPLPRLKPAQWLLLALAALVLAAGGWWVVRETGVLRHVNRENLNALIEQMRAFGPVPFFAALALLPAVGVPVMPFYLAAGVYGRPVAIAGTLTALAVNIAVTYVLARWLLHPVIERLMVRMGRKIPQVRRKNQWMITLLLRITPGPPFFVQSYLLALAGVPFGVYMLVSVPVAWTYAIGFLLVGESLLSGKSGQLIVGVSLVAVVLIAVKLIRSRLQRRVPEIAAIVEKTPDRPARPD